MSIATVQVQASGNVNERTFPRVFLFQLSWALLLGFVFYYFAM